MIRGCRILQWADKNRAFLKFKVHFWGQILIWSFWKRFSLKNLKLEEHLLLVSFLFSLRFEKLYSVNFGLNFAGSLQNMSDRWEQNNYIGLISDQNYFFGWMRDFILESCRDSTVYLIPIIFPPTLLFHPTGLLGTLK